MAPRNTVTELDAERVRANLAAVREEIAAAAARAGRDPAEVEIVTARQVRPGRDSWGCWPRPGSTLVGENRAQDLEAKRAACPGAFTWDFIGQLQSPQGQGSPPARALDPLRRLATRRSSSSASTARRRPRCSSRSTSPGRRARAASPPPSWPRSSSAARCAVVGLMTMPPLAHDPEDTRRHFAALRELAATHGLPQLSMGTTRISRSRWRRARRSCGWARACTLTLAVAPPAPAGNLPSRESPPHAKPRSRWPSATPGTAPSSTSASPRTARRTRTRARTPRPEPEAELEDPTATVRTSAGSRLAPPPRRDRRHLRRRGRPGDRPHHGAAARRRRAQRPRRARSACISCSPKSLQRRPGRGGQVQGLDPGDPQPAGVGDRSLQAPDRLLERLTYALDGGMQRIADKVFLLTPRNVEVSAEERARLIEKGFFNQS